MTISRFRHRRGPFSFKTGTGRSVFTKLAATGKYFVRAGVVVELAAAQDGGQSLSVVTPSALRSRLDREARHVAAYVRIKGDAMALREKRCSHSNAEALLATIEAREILPPIRLVARAAVIVPGEDGHPVVLGPGYQAVAGGVLVTGRETPARVELPEAVRALRNLLVDFEFATPGDESRTIAATITPALKMGGWLLRPTPVDVAESDHSQAGKGYRQSATRAIYSERAYHIAPREGGVGSMDESISTALISGRPFVALDNVRGRFDSQFLESVITWPESVHVRVPHRGEVSVDARAVTFEMTSNGVEATRDFVNRSSITRIRKRPKDYTFRAWPGGDLLAHVEAHADFYLGCVFAVIGAWADAGRLRLPLTATGFHDFKEWAGVLGWIVQELFRMSPLLEGHESAQARASNPALSWLRTVCLVAAERATQMDVMLSASAIVELCDHAGVDLPGLRSPVAEDQARKHVGKLLARCFREADDPNRLAIDTFVVHRVEMVEYDPDHRCERPVRRYRIEKPVPAVPPVPLEPITPTESRKFHRSNSLSGHTGQPVSEEEGHDERFT